MIFNFDGEETRFGGEGYIVVNDKRYTMKDLKKKLRERLEKHPELKKNFKNKKILRELGVEE